MSTPTIKTVSIENEWYATAISPRIYTTSIERVIEEEVFQVSTLPSIPLPACDDVNAEQSDIAVRASYMYRVLTNFLNLLEDDDREFLERYWGGLQQITEDYYLQAYQSDLSKNIFTVPVFRRSRWNEIILSQGSERAVIRSAITADTFDTSTATGDRTLTIVFDGNPVTITFSDTATNGIANVISEINTQVKSAFPGLDISVAYAEEGRLIIRSIDMGSTASILIDASDPNIYLGFYGGASDTGSGISTRAEPAQITGSVASPIFDTSIATGDNTLAITLNGGSAINISLPDDATTTIDAVKNVINSAIPSIATISTDNEIVLTSTITGDNSSVVISVGNTSLGFTGGDFSIGRGEEISDPIAERPVSYEVRVGTSDDDLNLVPLSDPAIVSIPALRSRIDGPTLVFGQGDSPHLGTDVTEADFGTNIDPDAELVSDAYIIRNGRIHFSRSVESQIRNSCLGILWAEDVYRNDTYLEKNFGFPIQVVRDNSIEYKNVLQGLHHSYWTGPNLKRTEIGLNLLFGLPVAPITGRIDQISVLSSPELIGTEASDVFDIRDANRTFAFTIDGIFVFAIFDPTNSYPDSGPATSHENYPAADVVSDINTAALAAGLGFSPASLETPQPGVYQIKLTGVNSVRIDSITGNAAIGFPPGAVSYGENTITINGQDFNISTEFPITKQPGDVVERLDPLTDGVEVLHYISDPLWWQVFGLASLDSNFSISKGYTQQDLRVINEILKYHVFGVKIVPDAFTRLGDIELGIVSKFVNDIRGITKNFILLIPFVLLDVFSISDDPYLTGFPDTGVNVELLFPQPTLNVSNWNQIGTNENAGIDPSSTSFTAANSGITRDNLVDGTFAGDTSGFQLDNEILYLQDNGEFELISASGTKYSPAIITANVAGPYDTSSSSGSFNISLNGFLVSFSFDPGPYQLPIQTNLTSGELAEAMNEKIDSLLGLPPGFPFAAITTDNKLRIICHRYDNVIPSVTLSSTVPEIGFTSAPGTVTGLAGLSSFTGQF